MTDEPKPLSKAELRKLEKEGEKVGKAPKEYIGIQYGAEIKFHETKGTGYGAILQPAHNKCPNLWLFSFKVTGVKCAITSCEYKLILIDEINEYLEGAKQDTKAVQPTQEIKDAIDEYLTSKGIGISFK